jgi:hypothetical protein
VRKAISVSSSQPKSKEVRLLLCDEEISNPYHIEVITPASKCLEGWHPVFLELEIPELDTTEWPQQAGAKKESDKAINTVDILVKLTFMEGGQEACQASRL